MSAPKILLIEDETDVLDANRTHLQQQGYQVQCVTRLADARAVLARWLPDIIVLDIMLPDGSGLAFCSELRRYSTTPVIFLTCLDSNADIIAGIERGGDDYITKPYDYNVLTARIKALLRRAGLAVSTRLELPPLTLDLAKNQAILHDKTVQLTQKELHLLAFLASHAGHELSKEQIYNEVWDGTAVGSLDTVKTHISNLRKKLGLDEHSAIVITATSRGNYVFTRTIF